METESLHEREEEKFLQRVADRVSEAAKRDAFDHLVLMSPARSMGQLRVLLSHAARTRVSHECVKDVLSEDIAAIAQRLSDLRLPAS